MNWITFAALEPLTLEVNVKLAVAIIFGIFLGFLLVKCDFADRVKVKENLTFSSMKMAKTLLFALALGILVFALLRNWHILQAHCPDAYFWGVLLGGICMGLGLGIGGLVPVTAVAALASGRLYAIWVLLGMALAIPAARVIRSCCSGILERLSAPVSASLEPGNGVFALDSPVLWLSVITFVLCMIMQLLGKPDDK